jgi:GNAT superfamily N-acetyltransferase
MGKPCPCEEISLRVEIRSNCELTPSEQETLDRWTHQVFGLEAAGYTWAEVDWHVLVWMEGELASHVEIIERTGMVGGRPVRLVGIGGVASAPEWRGRGLATVAMGEAAEFSCGDLDAEFGLLICGQEKIPFYRKLGWEVVDGPLVFDQPEGKVTFEDVVMVLPCKGQEWPTGTIDLCGLPW